MSMEAVVYVLRLLNDHPPAQQLGPHERCVLVALADVHAQVRPGTPGPYRSFARLSLTELARKMGPKVHRQTAHESVEVIKRLGLLVSTATADPARPGPKTNIYGFTGLDEWVGAVPQFAAGTRDALPADAPASPPPPTTAGGGTPTELVGVRPTSQPPVAAELSRQGRLTPPPHQPELVGVRPTSSAAVGGLAAHDLQARPPWAAEPPTLSRRGRLSQPPVAAELVGVRPTSSLPAGATSNEHARAAPAGADVGADARNVKRLTLERSLKERSERYARPLSDGGSSPPSTVPLDDRELSQRYPDLAHHVLEAEQLLGDRGSRGFYLNVLRQLGPDRMGIWTRALGNAREQTGVRRSRGALFNSLLHRFAAEAGLRLGRGVSAPLARGPDAGAREVGATVASTAAPASPAPAHPSPPRDPARGGPMASLGDVVRALRLPTPAPPPAGISTEIPPAASSHTTT